LGVPGIGLATHSEGLTALKGISGERYSDFSMGSLYGIKGFLNKPIEKRVLIQKALKTETGSIRL